MNQVPLHPHGNGLVVLMFDGTQFDLPWPPGNAPNMSMQDLCNAIKINGGFLTDTLFIAPNAIKSMYFTTTEARFTPKLAVDNTKPPDTSVT
jgi:prepilin-type processing-associated H-X9-DG protein